MEVKPSTKAKAAVATTVFPWDRDGAVCPLPLPFLLRLRDPGRSRVRKISCESHRR